MSLKLGVRRVVATGLIVSLLAPLATPAFAWKPKTHVYLAELAMRDAVDDGMVTLYQTDYATGRVLGPLGISKRGRRSLQPSGPVRRSTWRAWSGRTPIPT